MGRIVAPYGIKGWVRIQPFTQHTDGLLDYTTWLLGRDDAAWQPRAVDDAKVHGAEVVARFAGVTDREQAAALRGLRVAVSRDEFPQPAAGEFYWSDLVGLAVVNTAGVALGQVTRVFETGANDVLVVADTGASARERLIPFIAPVVSQVDVAGGSLVVDWDADF